MVDTLPVEYNLFLYHGDTFRRGIRLKENTDYLDLTGATVNASIKWSRADLHDLIPVTLTIDPDQVTNKGLLWLVIEPSDFAALPRYSDPEEVAVWDLEVTWPSGDVVTYLAGSVGTQGDVFHG